MLQKKSNSYHTFNVILKLISNIRQELHKPLDLYEHVQTFKRVQQTYLREGNTRAYEHLNVISPKGSRNKKVFFWPSH